MTKILITKADGTPMKSKINAIQYLKKKGIDKELLIEENGQFFYEDEGESDITPPLTPPSRGGELLPVSWETDVFDKNNERTKIFIPGTDVVATIIGKHPAGQNRNKSSFEINIGDENFIMSVNLISKIFKVAAAGAVAQSGAWG